MNPTLRSETTALLVEAVGGDAGTVDRLFPIVYEELRGIARRQLARERPDHTLQTTALVHEAYVRLVDDDRVSRRGRAYFFASAARAMRQILVDHARRRGAAKRGGGVKPITLGNERTGVDAFAEELIDLDQALERLAELDPRHARVVECRYFGGMTVEETAAALDVSPRTVRYDWALAKAWLHQALKAGGEE
ncbi:MAG: sigma-70 family RNA polymerase sigma factor [Gemmatimonadota bacterium]